ncbi:MAG: putative 2-hydroxy-3-oxopropionate reductase, partial [Deltaproteobacteria bacterium]|nr:putative 2-hydroxy-3-oxopropionate reductase [Deltaproteobacteria bacterium]
MGKPMAGNVLNAGFELTVYDLRDDVATELIARGAKLARSPGAVAANAEIVELAVVDDAQVEEVLTGEHGVFAGARPGMIVAIHSTVLPETVRRLAAIGDRNGVR